MNILNMVCNYSVVILASLLFLFLFVTFCLSIYTCFPKKKTENEGKEKGKGDLLAKIVVTIFTGCLLPWVLKVIFYYIAKIAG